MMGRHHKQNAIRRYLLNQLSDAEQQSIELRVLSDEDLYEELEFVEDELIDEYIARELSEAERLAFEETFLAHPERKRKLEAGRALKRYLDAAPPPAPKPGGLNSLRKWLNQHFFSLRVGLPVAAIIVVVAGLGIWRGIIYQSDLEKGLIALNAAYSEQRPTETRVSNLSYARFIATRNNEPKPVNEIELRRADRFLNDSFDRTPDSYHALGKFFLLQGNTDKAIEYFEEARKADPNNATIYADLGAAYFEKGKQQPDTNTTNEQQNGKDLETFGRSLEYLNHALELDPNLLEALFNRAIVRQHQKLFNLAKSDWRAYLEKDSTSQWAAEAQTKLRELEGQKELGSQNNDKLLDPFMRAYRARDDDAAWDMYRRKYSSSGNAVTNALIQDLLANNLNPHSTESSKALVYLGQLEIRKTQDSFTSDLSQVYATASSKDLKLLDQARQQMVKGYELLGQARINDANKLFDSALTTFQKAGDTPETLAAQTAIVHGAVVQPDLAKARELLAEIITTCESKNYKWLLAQTLQHRAHLQSNHNNFSQAISDSERSLQIFQELNDVSGTIRTFIQLASLNLSLNDVETSFSYLRRGLALTNSTEVQLGHLWGMHVALSLNFHVLKLYRAALDYQNEALQLVLRHSKAALLHSRSYGFLGLTNASASIWQRKTCGSLMKKGSRRLPNAAVKT
jgi:tetratricopeptide (TPR) repeat protein